MIGYKAGDRIVNKYLGAGTVKEVLYSGSLVVLYDSGDELTSSPQYTSLETPPPERPKTAEWTDPSTGETYTCPERFTKVIDILQRGAENALTAKTLLGLLGEKNSDVNQRHLRQATMIARGENIFVVSVRSTDGGYFIATKDEEITDFVNAQLKLAASMTQKANSLSQAWQSSKVL
jgi:hypothetical protein